MKCQLIHLPLFYFTYFTYQGLQQICGRHNVAGQRFSNPGIWESANRGDEHILLAASQGAWELAHCAGGLYAAHRWNRTVCDGHLCYRWSTQYITGCCILCSWTHLLYTGRLSCGLHLAGGQRISRVWLLSSAFVYISKANRNRNIIMIKITITR